MSSTNLEETVQALAERIQALEDELAIHRLIVRYGFAVDIGDADRAAAAFAPDGVYDVDIGRMDGRDAIRAMVNGERHQSMVGHCAHQIGPVAIERHSATQAMATGYSRVYLETRAGIHIYRVSCNRWELAKHDGRWLIARRITRLLGHAEASAVLRRAFESEGPL